MGGAGGGGGSAKLGPWECSDCLKYFMLDIKYVCGDHKPFVLAGIAAYIGGSRGTSSTVYKGLAAKAVED